MYIYVYIYIYNHLAVEFIYLATSVECAGPINRPTTELHEKNENDGITIFLHSLVIWWFLKFVVVFGGKLTKPCHHARTAHLASHQGLASIINKKPKTLTKRTPVATTINGRL